MNASVKRKDNTAHATLKLVVKRGSMRYCTVAMFTDINSRVCLFFKPSAVLARLRSSFCKFLHVDM